MAPTKKMGERGRVLQREKVRYERQMAYFSFYLLPKIDDVIGQNRDKCRCLELCTTAQRNPTYHEIYKNTSWMSTKLQFGICKKIHLTNNVAMLTNHLRCSVGRFTISMIRLFHVKAPNLRDTEIPRTESNTRVFPNLLNVIILI